jgi:hypothetical protein
MSRKSTWIFILLSMVTWQFSCGQRRQEDCAKHIKEVIHPGLPLKDAENDLKICGFKTSIDKEKKTLYGDKVVTGSVVSERTQVSITFDYEEKVITVIVTTGLIGP